MIISYTGTDTMEDSKCLLARMTIVMYVNFNSTKSEDDDHFSFIM